MSDEMFNKVKDIIVDQLGVEKDKVTMEARFREDLEADSLDLVELIKLPKLMRNQPVFQQLALGWMLASNQGLAGKILL